MDRCLYSGRGVSRRIAGEDERIDGESQDHLDIGIGHVYIVQE